MSERCYLATDKELVHLLLLQFAWMTRDDFEEWKESHEAAFVRCRDCKHYDGSHAVPRCGRTERKAEPNGYCAWGERMG